MTTVVVVEPQALLRLGILHHLADVFPELSAQGLEDISGPEHHFFSGSCDLMLLSVSYTDCALERIDVAHSRYAPHRLLLLSDGPLMPRHWRGLPSSVMGYLGRSSSLPLLTAAIERALDYTPFSSVSVIRKSEKPANDCSASRRLMSVSVNPGTMSPAITLASKITFTPDKKVSIQDAVALKEAKMLGITARQYEVLVYLAHGYPNQCISQALNVSISTVRKHAQEIYTRLNVNNRNQAVCNAIMRGAALGLSLK